MPIPSITPRWRWSTSFWPSLEQKDGVVPPLLERIGADPSEVSSAIRQALGGQAHGARRRDPAHHVRASCQRAKQGGAGGRRRSRTSSPRTEHLLLAVLDTDGEGRDLLKTRGVTREAVLEALKSVRGNQRVTDQNPEARYQSLEKYSRDLTELARKEKLDPVIGRDEEIRRVMQVLARRTKNNPVLIGEPGVGKTAIVEGLARRIVSGDVPDSLKDKKLLALDLGALVAGHEVPRGVRGAPQGRDQGDHRRARGSIILFIDELHTLVGAGAAEGAMDASNLLKPALARGELRAIGATTLDEYRKRIEKDPALERRFQPIFTSQPTVEDTIAILRGLKERYEVHHGVRIRDDAIIAAAVLSDRYITNRFLPDKAIDLIDEAASRLKMEIESQPTELDRAERRILQLNIEKQALSKETDPASRERLAALEKELADLGAKRDAMKLQWRHGEGDHRADPKAQGRAGGALDRRDALRAGGQPQQGGRDQARQDPRDAAQAGSEEQGAGGPARRDAPPAGGSLRGGHRPDRLPLDGHPGLQDAGLGEDEAPEAGGDPVPSASWGSSRPSSRFPTPSGATSRACPTRRARSAPSSSWARRGSARPSWPRRWRTSSSATRRPSPAST